MKLVHLELKVANDLVAQLHRHHKPAVGHRFSIGVQWDDKLVGAAIIGRPVSRELDFRSIVEVVRLVTDGTPNACSFLYSAAARAAKALGYGKIQTYILDSEPGTSLKAAGWKYELTTGGGDWNTMFEAMLPIEIAHKIDSLCMTNGQELWDVWPELTTAELGTVMQAGAANF